MVQQVDENTAQAAPAQFFSFVVRSLSDRPDDMPANAQIIYAKDAEQAAKVYVLGVAGDIGVEDVSRTVGVSRIGKPEQRFVVHRVVVMTAREMGDDELAFGRIDHHAQSFVDSEGTVLAPCESLLLSVPIKEAGVLGAVVLSPGVAIIRSRLRVSSPNHEDTELRMGLGKVAGRWEPSRDVMVQSGDVLQLEIANVVSYTVGTAFRVVMQKPAQAADISAALG